MNNIKEENNNLFLAGNGRIVFNFETMSPYQRLKMHSFVPPAKMNGKVGFHA